MTAHPQSVAQLRLVLPHAEMSGAATAYGARTSLAAEGNQRMGSPSERYC